MKWLSVKKYKPLPLTECFICLKTGDFYVGKYIKSMDVWDCDSRVFSKDDVTHLCIPDPLEISEDENRT